MKLAWEFSTSKCPKYDEELLLMVDTEYSSIP